LISTLPAAVRKKFLEELTDEQVVALLHDWKFWARKDQLVPNPSGPWTYWLILTGRGWGKTRTGSETINKWSHNYSPMNLVARTAADARDVMVEGESGILSCAPPWHRPKYEPSKRRLTWPNGARATLFSADEPEALRGPQCARSWCDEVATWPYIEAWNNLQFGLRLGRHPRCIVTSTPRPVHIIRDLVAQEASGRTIITRGTTYDNYQNLAQAFIDTIITKYEGTSLGNQELLGQLLEQAEGALWKRSTIDANRVAAPPENIVRVTIGVDPPGSTAECGIQAGALGADGKGYHLGDYSMRGSPAQWGEAVVRAYDAHDADDVVAETNNGGDMVVHVVQTAARELHRNGERPSPDITVRKVHASRGKNARAEPVSALSEQHRILHACTAPETEDQLCNWVPDDTSQPSPDRLDAFVWAFTHLMIKRAGDSIFGATVSGGTRSSPWTGIRM